MDFTDCLFEKEFKGNPSLCRLLEGAECCTQKLSLYYTKPGRNFRETKYRNYFSKIDISDPYLQILVEEKCSKLLCINTHRGLYKFGRLPFGVKVMPVIFQEVMDTMLSDLDFSVAYSDDILILFTNPSTRAGYDTRSIFKRSLAGLNLEFSFS